MKKIIILISFLFPLISFSTVYYVSNSGSDAANGTSPGTSWQTISKVNSMMSSFAAGDVIRFNRGDIFVGSIVIGKSGGSGNPIKFATYGSGANPVISGFSTVAAWTSIGTNLWQSTSAASTLSTLNMVLVSGAFTPIGKWPDGTNVYANIGGASGNTQLTGSGVPTAVPAGVTGGQVVIRKNHWIIDKSAITGQSGNTLNFTSPNNYGITIGCTGSSCWGFFVQNCQAVCTAQNEWWYDGSTKKIGMFSVGTPATTKVSTVDIVLNISTFSFLRFDSLDFEGSNTSTVNISSGGNIDFEDCNFTYNGMNGFQCQSAANHITVNNCSGLRTNNNFINGGGSTSWIITNNIIQNTAQVAGMGNSSDGNYIGMYNVGANSLIQYNQVTKSGYSGIDFRGASISVLNNLVDTFCNVKDDGAGIYTFTGTATTTYAQRFVTSNIVLNGGNAGAGTNTTNGDAFGIYMDDNSSQVMISGNTVANCDGAGIFFHADHDLTVTNNTVYNCPRTGGYGAVLEIYPGAVATALVRNITFTRNKIVTRATNQIVAYLKTDEANMTQWGRWDSNWYARPINDAASTSTFTLVTSTGTQVTNLAGWQPKSPGGEVHSKKSPVNISTLTDLRFDYNATNAPAVVSLGGLNYIDVAGVSYPGSITLPAYGSAVLIKQGGTANNLPVVNAGPDQTKTLPTNTATMAGSATDADGTIVGYLWTKISGPAATITNSASATTTITGLVAGVYQFQLQATDNSGGIDVDVMQITVNAAANTAPVANAGVDKAITLPVNTVNVTGSGSDIDGLIVAYQWTQIGSTPSTAVIVNASQAATTINGLGTSGTYKFQLRVTDNLGANGFDTMQVVVSPPSNPPPIADAGIDQTITGTSTTVTGTSSDPGGSIASVAWSTVSVPIGNGTLTYGTPNANTTTVGNMTTVGAYTLKYTAIDNLGATTSDNIVIQKNGAANINPTSNAGGDQSITLPTNSVNVSGSGSSDADGSIVAYLWTKVSGPTSFNIVSASQVNTAINNLVQGVYQFNLRVTDNNGAIANDVVQITVNAPANTPPIVSGGPNITITQPATSTSVTGTASDPGGSIAGVQWTFVSGPGPTPTFGSSTALTTTVNGMTSPGAYTIKLTATDNLGATASANVVIQVNAAANILPIADAGPDQIDTLPNDAILDGIASSDADGTIVSYQWTKISGGNATIVSATQRRTVITNLVAGSYTFQLKVTDNSGGISTDLVVVTVEEPVSPQPTLPTANAGPNYKVYLCSFCGNTASLTVTGSATEGSYPIASYQWTKLSGPAATIGSPSSASTLISGLAKGTYVFQLTATDANDASASDTMTIIVTKNYLFFGRRVIVINY